MAFGPGRCSQEKPTDVGMGLLEDQASSQEGQAEHGILYNEVASVSLHKTAQN